MSERVVVTGVPGSGKDFLLAQAAPRLRAYGFSQINFGEAMQAYTARVGTGIDRDSLRSLERPAVRSIISLVMEDLVRIQGPIVLNTHMVFKQEGDYVCAPQNIAAFEPTHIALIWAAPHAIARRRGSDMSRSRETEPVGLIRLHQELLRAAAETMADNLSADFLSLENTVDGGWEASNQLCEGVMR